MSRMRTSAIALAAAALGGSMLSAVPAQAVVTPPAPASGTPGLNSIAVTWTADPTAFGKGYIATAYTSPGGVADDTCGAASGVNNCTITGLTGGQAYNVTIVGISSGDTTESVTVGPYTPWGAPSAPTGLTSVAGNQRAYFSWTAASANGKPLLTYNVVNTATSTLLCTVAAPTTSCTATGLTNATAYTAAVFAVNEAGTSVASSTTSVTPTAGSSPPATPTIGTASAASSSTISVAFTPGAAVTGFPVTAFNATCTSSNGGTPGSASGAASPIVVSSLTPGTSYTCSVTATNANSTSTASAASNTVSLQSGLPGAPTAVTGTAGNAQVALSWVAATGTVTGYQTQYSSNSGVAWINGPVVVGTATEATVTTLANGTAYVFRVRAINSSGEGPWSTPSQPVTPTAVPGAPTAVTGVPGNQAVTLNWTAPSGTVTGYKVRYSSDNGATWSNGPTLTGTATTTTVSGLSNGTGYIFQVLATNAAGDGPWSTSSALVRPGSPAAPTTVSGVPGVGQIAVSWQMPLGAAPTGYEIQYSSDNVTWLPTTPIALTSTVTQPYALINLTNGTAYNVRVRALNGTLSSSFTTTTSAVTPVALPGTPTGVSGLSGNAQVSLSWTAPASTTAAPVTGYKVQYSTNGGVSWTAGPVLTTAVTSATVTGLTNGQSYVFQVQATNGSGPGPWSASSAPVTPGAPAAPTSLTAVAGDSSAVLTWTILLGSSPTSYEIQYSTDGANWLPTTPIPVSAAERSYTLRGLTNGVAYFLRVRAMSGVVPSAWTQMIGTVTPVLERSITIDRAERKRNGEVVVSGVARGFLSVNIRIRVWQENKGRWAPWRSIGSADVEDGRYLFLIDKSQSMKIRVLKDGVQSRIVEVD